ncbi:hypothetical protein D1871_11045 [Nakamurella silvestris]|nr:hypothetical protein D1871_11045 [Nakamurella silvestris]
MSVKLTPWARVIAGVIGALSLGAGGASVFLSEVEAGPVALILVGLALLLTALSGLLPAGIEWGDKKWHYNEERIEKVEAKLRRLDPPAYEVGDFSVAGPGELAAELEKQAIYTLLSIKIPGVTVDFDTSPYGPDAIARSASGAVAPIEVKYRLTQQHHGTFNQMNAYRAKYDASRAILIVGMPVSEMVRHEYEIAAATTIVDVSGDFRSDLRAAVAEALDINLATLDSEPPS